MPRPMPPRRVHAKGASLGRLVELVQPQRHWQALDIATGAGHTAAAFAPHVARVIASDLTEEMLLEAAKLAAAKGLANMETARADAEALPFEDARFDLVTCRIAAHHFPDVPTFVAEVWRVLKGGGTFALVDNISPDADLDAGLLRAPSCATRPLVYNAFEKIRDPSHGRCLGMAEWSEVLADTGLEVAAQGAPAQGHGVPALGRAPGLRCGDDRAAARHADGGRAGAEGVPQAAARGRQALVHPRRSHRHRPQAA